MKLFSRKELKSLGKQQESLSFGIDKEELKKIPKKRRAKAIKLFKEYEAGLIIRVNEDIDQKELIQSRRGL